MSENREYITCEHEKGTIYISEDVLAMTAGAAALEVEGVVSLAGGNFSEQLIGKKNLARGVEIQRVGDTLTLNVSIVVKFGNQIPAIAKEVQDVVADHVEGSSGLQVKEVNVRVSGIAFDKKQNNT